MSPLPKTADLDGHDLPPTPAVSSPSLHGKRRRYALSTELVCTDAKDQYGASSVPVYLNSTFKQGSARGGEQEYDYTRSGNPTRSHLERHLAKVMGAHRVAAVGSGMSALDVVTRLLRAGEEVVAGDDLYGGSNRLLTFLAKHNGITVHHVDTTKVEEVVNVLSPKTAMVLLETPTNPLLKIVDLPAIARAVHQYTAELAASAVLAPTPVPVSILDPRPTKALVVVDNTMLSPLLCNPLDLGADIVYESGTKYLSGHHDVMAGVVAVNDPTLADWMSWIVNASGCGLSPADSYTLLRGVKTLALRMEKQQANAARIARFLEGVGFDVRYPGLESHPSYELHKTIARGAGGVLSFMTGDAAVSEKVVEATQLWTISVSFGCVNSLISMPCLMSHASIDAKTRKERALPEDLIRLSVGIEDADDLIDDLTGALIQAGAVTITLDGLVAGKAAQVAEVSLPTEEQQPPQNVEPAHEQLPAQE